MYGKWLYKEIKTEYGLCRVEIYRKGYTASAIEIGAIVGDSLTLSLENMGAITDAIGKSVCSFSIIDTAQVEYDDFFTPDATAYKVVVSTKVEEGAYTTRWSGYLTPDFFAENLSYRTPISISARDNIGYLSDVDFDLDVATITVRELIQAAFNRIAEDYPMELVFETQKQTEDGVLAIDATISTYLLRGLSWYEAIETVLHDLGLQMRWVDNNAIAIMDISQLGEIFALQRFNFIDNSGYREILPAWRELAQEQSYGVLDNFYKGHIDRENKLEYAANSAINSNILLYQPKNITQWSRQGEVYFLNFYNSYNAEIDDDKQDAIFITGVAPSATNADVLGKKMVYSQAVTEVDKQIKMTFSLNDTLRTPLASQYSRGERNTLFLPYSAASGTTMLKTPHPYQLKYRFNIFLRANDGTNYVMREDWVEEAALNERPFIEFLTDKLQTVDTGVTDGQGNHRFAYTGYNNSKEYSITIGSIPKAGTLEFAIYPWTFEQDAYPSVRDAATYQRGAKISKIEFSVQVGKTGVEARTQIGVLHNIAEKINYSFGQVPQREGDVITYAGGLFQSDTITALQGFRRNANSTTYPLVELVGREVIHFNKKNYTKLSGTAKNLAKEPLMFNKLLVYKGKNYLPFACSLDVISNTMNITTMQEVEPYETAIFNVIDSQLITGGGTVSGGNNTILQYNEEAGNEKRLYELQPATEQEKSDAYVLIDKAGFAEARKVHITELGGLNVQELEQYLTENGYASIKDYWAYDEESKTLRTQHTIVAEGEVIGNRTAEGGNTDAGGGGSYDLLESWEFYDENKREALGANLGYELKQDLEEGLTWDEYKDGEGGGGSSEPNEGVVSETKLVKYITDYVEYLGLKYIEDGDYLKATKPIVSEEEIISCSRAEKTDSDAGGDTGEDSNAQVELTSEMIVKALGYTPYNADNPQGFITSEALDAYAKREDVPSLEGYAKQSWVQEQKYLTSVPEEYVTEQELNSKGYATVADVQEVASQLDGLEERFELYIQTYNDFVEQHNNFVNSTDGRLSELEAFELSLETIDETTYLRSKYTFVSDDEIIASRKS